MSHSKHVAHGFFFPTRAVVKEVRRISNKIRHRKFSGESNESEEGPVTLDMSWDIGPSNFTTTPLGYNDQLPACRRERRKVYSRL